jgi:hypothetical protein
VGLDASISGAPNAHRASAAQVHDVFDQARMRTSAGSSADRSPVRRSGNSSSASSATRLANDETRSTVGATAQAGAPQRDPNAPSSPQGAHTLAAVRLTEGVESRMQQAKDRWLDQQSMVAGEDGRAELVAAQLTASMFAQPGGSNSPQFDSPVPMPTVSTVRDAHY